MAQLALDICTDTRPQQQHAHVELTLEARFAEFHRANSHVFTEMVRLARARLAKGTTRIGVKSLWEELRETLRVTRSGDYKLNNSYTALYARMLIEQHPDLDAFIETRRRGGRRVRTP